MEYEKVYFTGITEAGCCIYGCSITMPQNWTMKSLVKALKENGYQAFMLVKTMDSFEYI